MRIAIVAVVLFAFMALAQANGYVSMSIHKIANYILFGLDTGNECVTMLGVNL